MSKNTEGEERKARMVAFVKLYQQAFPGLSPTYRSIMDAAEIPSTSMVAYYAQQLMDNGVLDDIDLTLRKGVLLKDAVLLTKADARALGLDWDRLLGYKERARQQLQAAGLWPVEHVREEDNR